MAGLSVSRTVSREGAGLFDGSLPTTEPLPKWESILSNPAAAVLTQSTSYSKSFVAISAVLTAPSPGADSTAKKPLCLPIPKKQLVIC